MRATCRGAGGGGGYEHANDAAVWTHLSKASQVEVLQPDGGGGGSGDDDGGCVRDGHGVGAVSAARWGGGGMLEGLKMKGVRNGLLERFLKVFSGVVHGGLVALV
jgi:hypothetical protein